MTLPTRRVVIVGTSLLLAATVAAYWLWPDRSLAAARDAAARRDFATALDRLNPALDASRPDPEALLLGARTARRAGQTALADRYLRRYQERGGDAEVIAVERILAGVQRGELAAYDGFRFCEQNPTHPEVPFVLEAVAQGSLKTGHLNRATDAANRWMATHPPPADRAQALLWRGTCSQHLGQIDAATADFLEAVALTPDSADARTLAGTALVGRDPAAALAHFAVALDREPDRADARIGVARCRRNRGESDLARAELDRVLTARPDHLPALVERAKLAIDAGDYPAAERDLRRALASAPRFLDANATLVRVLQLTGRDAEAGQVQQTLKAAEAELFRKIEERVAAGMIPAPPKGTVLPGPGDP